MVVGRFEHLTFLAVAVAVAVGLMIVLRLIGTRTVEPMARQMLAGDGSYDYFVDCIGEHLPTLDRFSARASTRSGFDCVAELVPEASQTKDALRIRVVIEGATVGEVARHDIMTFMEAMNAKPTQCCAVITMTPGESGLRVAVRLDTAWPPELA